MKRLLGVMVLLLSAGPLKAASMKAAAGFELGGSGTLLASDLGLKAFGMGAGYQYSLFGALWTDKPIGGKFRIESLSLNEEAIQKTNTDYIATGTSLKSMSQKWTYIGVGAEGRFESQGQLFFWELLTGYAIGADAPVSVTYSTVDQGPLETTQTTASGLAFAGGIGIKKNFSDRVVGIMTVRSFLLMGAPYSSTQLTNKSFFLFPVLFNLGLEFPFGI